MTRKITFRFAGPSLFALALAMPIAMSPIAAPPAETGTPVTVGAAAGAAIWIMLPGWLPSGAVTTMNCPPTFTCVARGECAETELQICRRADRTKPESWNARAARPRTWNCWPGKTPSGICT